MYWDIDDAHTVPLPRWRGFPCSKRRDDRLMTTSRHRTQCLPRSPTGNAINHGKIIFPPLNRHGSLQTPALCLSGFTATQPQILWLLITHTHTFKSLFYVYLICLVWHGFFVHIKDLLLKRLICIASSFLHIFMSLYYMSHVTCYMWHVMCNMPAYHHVRLKLVQ